MSFLSATVGALGSTISQSSVSPQALYLGLVVGAISKALPSLATKGKDWVEDAILFAAAVASAVATGLQNGGSFSSPTGLAYALLLIGFLLKTGLSLWHGPMKIEDIAAFGVAIVSLVLVPFSVQYASIGTYLSLLSKTLLNSQQTTDKQQAVNIPTSNK
jgi:hypothetical protein